jgi:hypothetical protein
MAGTSAIMIYGTRYLWKQDKKHKALAIIMLAGGTAAHGYAIQHNWRL